MRGAQSELVLAESEKDKDNYSLNRQSLRWHPHNQASVCIIGSSHKAAGQQFYENEEPSNKIGECQPR